MEYTTVLFRILRPEASAPVYASEAAAGADLRACIPSEVSVAPGETVWIPTGLAVEIPGGLCGLVYARSGLASKQGLAPANKVGVIDSDYRGEILIALHNHASIPALISPGDRIAQFVLTPVVHANFQEAESLGETDRGNGGFGSTGVQ